MSSLEKEDRRVRKTKKALQAAMIELLQEKPFSKLQIKEISERADVSRQIFYAHFDSKESLLFSYLDDVFLGLRAAFFDDVSKSKNADLKTLCIMMFQHWAANAEVLRWVIQFENKDQLIAHLREHLARIGDDFAELPSSGVVKDSMEPYLFDFVTGGVYMLLKRWMREGSRLSAEELGNFTFKLIQDFRQVSRP